MYNNQTQLLRQTPQDQPVFASLIIVKDINDANNYPLNSGTSQFFVNMEMSELRMKRRDINGYQMLDRVFKLEEVTQPSCDSGVYATKDDLKAVNDKLDQLLSMWQSNNG